MSGDKFDQLYNALKADGAVSGSRANFRNFVYASGKQGYQNRKKLYDALHADGAVSSKSYEEFAQRLGLHATNPQSKVDTSQSKQQSSKHQTAAQMAMSQGYRKPQQSTSYVQKPQRAKQQQPRSAFVQGLYDQDDEQRQQHIDYISPNATQQMVTTRQKAQKQAARKAVDTIVNTEQRRRNQPIVKTGTPADQSIVKTQGQWENEMDASVNKLVNSDLGSYLDKVIGDEFKSAHARGLAALSAAGGPYTHGTGGADYYVGERAYQQQMDSQKQLENITGNIQRNIEATFSDPKIKKRVMDDAARLGVDPEQYITQHLAPALIQKASDQFNKTQLNRMMAKGSSDYIASGILNSLTGTLLTGLTTSKNQRQMQQEADAMTEEGQNPNYQPGIVDKAARGAVGFMADAPAFNLTGKVGSMVAGRVLGNGVAQAARLANMSKLQRAVYMAKNGAVSQGVTGILYGSTNSVAQNMSTGEDNSIGTNLKLALKGGLSEGASFATMGAIGGAVGGLGYGIGATWREPSLGKTVKNAFKKIGYEGFKVVSEGIGMHVGGQVANLIENGKFDLSVAGTLEDVANVVALKLTHAPKLSRMRGEDGKKESISDAIIRKFGEFVTSDAEKNSMWQLSSDDKDAIMVSGNLNSVRDLGGLKASYQKIMADPNVSWDAKAKYSAMVMGVMPSSRPMGDYHTFTFEKVGGDKAGYKKYVSEYAADGTLLSKRSYNTADERENALYNDAILKENARMDNSFALSVNADTSDRELQKQFLLSKGFDESKPLDYHVNRTLAAGMQDHDSAIYKEFVDYAANNGETGRIVDAVAQQNGMTREQLVNAFQNKDVLKRTDAEQNACVQLRRAFEGAVFKEGDSHPEQSHVEGKDVASDNNLGTEQPNGEAVKQELNGLRQAEAEMDVLMRDNDVFGQHFEELKKQGLTNPQIYQWMIENGLTQEQLEPFAHYINANARVLGMQEATKQKIEEVVSGVVQDWSYKGELNGQKMNGEQVVYVQDSDGRVLIVGSGDVAFDPTTGRAKEDVGDLLICFDPNTKEMVYLKTDDVTFMQTQMPEDFANEYRQRLQMINSQPYNEAAQEQAMQDAGKPQQEAQPNESKNEEGKESNAATGVEGTAQGAAANVESAERAKGNALEEGASVNQEAEQPQQTRKFADGTDVPMTKDSKGRPTPDYGAMKPEQAAEILSQDLGDSAEPYVDAQIKQAEKAVKDAEKMKIDMSGEPNDVIEQQKAKAKTIEAAKKQLEQAQNIKKAMTAKAVAETMGKPTEAKVEGANEASGEVAKKFQNAPRLQGNHVSKRLPNGDKISGHYEIVPAESLTPSHDVMNDYKKSEGFPVDAEGRTINDRDYEHDKAAQQTTDQMAQKYSGQAITQVPTVSDEGIVYDGNGRTMAGQKAAKNGTDAEYIEDLMDNAQNYGFTKEQIEQSGIEHPRLVMVTDERLPYDTATFSMFNRNEKKTQSNTEQAVAKAKTLTSEEVGAIVADIEGNGSLDAFFNNSKAINDLVKTLVSKGVIGQNEVAGFMDGPDRLSAQGKEYVKNLLLGSVFKPETIRMLGVDSKIKNAAINGIRAIMDNLKLGDYSLRDELDQAVQLLYEARRSKMSVEDLLKQSSAFEENARDRFPMIAQAMAQALEDKPTTFRELMSEYNNIAKNYNTNEGTLGFYDKLTPEQVVEEFLNASKTIKNNNIKLYGNETGHSETERGNDAAGNEEPSNEAGGAAGTEGNGNAETEPEIKVKKALKRIATEITKQTGIEVVTDEQKAKKALDETENIKVQRASAGSTVSGMEKMPKGLQMNPSVLTDQILNYHGDHIAKLLGEVPEDSTVKYFSAHNGVWYFYRVDHDRNIILDGAISANKDNYREYEQKIKEYYGIDGGAEAIYNYVQEAGFDTGANRNLHDYFLEGGNTRHSAMGERPNEPQGEARIEDNGTAGRTLRQGVGEEQSGAIKEFRSANGEVYGFTVDGKIYLDTKKMKPETPLHEYTHLWTEALRNSNPTEWENVKGLFDEVDGLKEEVQKLYPELKGDDLYEEMITTFSGREGAKKLEEVVRGLAKEDGKTVEESSKATGFIAKVKEALQKYWKGVADMLHIHFTSAEEVADKVLADWASGFNPNNFDDLHDKELENRIKVTDEETETPSDNGPITKQKILIDGDKEVTKVDAPDEKGEYTGSYYEYDGKRFGDLKEVADYIDGNGKQEKLPVMPKPVEPSNPIEKAAEDYKREHPMTEDEILNTTVFDDLPEDQKQYCIDAALDYLNGEDTSAIAEAYYRNAYEKRVNRPAETEKVAKIDEVEQPKPSADPMEGLKNAAEGYEKEKNAPKAEITTPEKPKTRKQLEAEKNAADNEFEAFMKDLRKKRSGQLNSGFIDQNLIEAAPKMFSLAAKCAYTRIKLGMYDAKEVVKDLRERFKDAFDGFDKRDVETFYSEIMNQKWRDGDKRMSLNEWAEHYKKVSPEYKEKLEGDSKDAEERKMSEKKFIDRVNIRLGFGQKINGIVELRKMAEECGLKDVKDTDLQELAETAIVKRARGIATSASTNDARKFELIKKLYENQPSLNQRDSERVMKQQYSTPAPYAFLADMYVKGGGKEVKSALEPSAGNGMLTIGLPMDVVHVNDIDAQRLANLRRQGFKNVTSQDGTQPFADKDVDVVVTNPPFGSATPKEYDGYKISSLEGQMAINALDSMKDDGRAAIIIGGKTEYAKNGSLNPKDKAFLGYLYSHYNVEDVINVDGSLYAKQGTTYPTRIILINGRRLDENAFPPVKSKARAEAVKDYDELYKRISDDILRGERMDSSIKEGKGSARPELDRPSSADTHEEGVRMGEQRGSEQKPSNGTERLSSESSISGTNDVLDNRQRADREPDGELSGRNREPDRAGAESSPSEGTEARANSEGRVLGSGGNGRNDAQLHANEPTNTRSGGRPRGQLQRMDESVRGLSTEKVKYSPKSENPFTLDSVTPADQQEAVNKNLEKLGDADQFLVDELGYNDKDDLYSHLAAEQVDSVALALQQAKKGNAFIIGDMTGVGKGRQAASFVRYAIKNKQIPVYFTKTPELLSDVYRDLVDVGSPDLRPFILGDENRANVTDSEGNIVYKVPSKKEKQRVLDYIEKHGELPKEYDYVLTTYSQVGNAVYEYDENGNRKERKLPKGKSFGAAALSGQRRRDAIEKLMDNAYLILDESHTAGGNSGQGNYFQHIIQKAKNVTFFSATFAKRPDNMPIYALRTAMNQGGLKSSDLIDAVKRGGATLQEIMSQTLTQCGQMIRRERDMTGVTIDWRAIDEPEKVKEQREQYDSIIGLFNDIINFQKTYVSGYVEEQNEAMAAMQATMGIKRGTEALGIKNVPFASKAFNTVQQVLLSLKAKSAAERAIDYLKQGMKPVIALNNTNESQTGNIALGEEMDAPDLGTSLRKGLEGTLRYTSKNAKDESSSGYIRLEDLGDDAVEAYHNLEKKIKETSTGLSLSPIDVIKNELEKAGYKVGELTGRSTEFVYNENGTVTKVKRTDTDKKKLAREFNDGQIDALILNKSAATGISLHASSKYKDQRKRVMIVAQQQLDVNDEVQMRGRIDRTGQVARGAYEYVVSLIPAEQRLLMMFKAKLKSLDANTTSSQKSKFNEMEVADITNKYGDKVVREYMAEHLDLYSRMADPFGWEKSFGDDLSSTPTQSLVVTKSGVGDGEAGADASKLLGRMALLKVAEQEKMLNEIGELYANEIQRLNEMGENDLEITELPLKAKTISKEVWKEGAEPGGDNAFADNTYIEKVNMAILKKPMKADEVKKAQDGLTGGKSWDEYKEEKWKTIESYFVNKGAEEGAKIEERARKAAAKAREKYIKDAKRGQKDSGMTDEQIAQMAIYQQDNIYKQESAKSEDLIKNLKNKAGMFLRVLETFNTEDAYVLPVDMNKPDELSGFGNSYGRLIDIKITDNFSPNASSVSFATLDGRRKITFPISGMVGSGENRTDVIAAIDRMTRQASGLGDKHLRVLSMNVNNWDKLVSNESRKDGYIVTGNLMQALIDSKNQGVGGQLVKYTTDTGEVKTGILMPDRFKPTDVANEYPISSVADKFELPSHKGGIEQAVSSDGEVKVILGFDHGDTYYQIQVPKSKAKGGKYFLDKDLLSMVRGHNFESRGNRMMANIDENQLRPVLARLSNLGVKVREERKSSEDGTHYRTADGEQGNDAQSIVANHIANVSEKVGVKANEVNSVDEITNPRVKADIEAGKNVTGWYDEKTGEVHLYMPNIHDRYTAEKTIWHEVVGHKGMRELFGEDRFNRFLRDVWYDLDKPENADLKKLVDEEMKYNPLNAYNAIEEGLARLAEEGRGEAGFWRNLKNKVTDFLHEIGYRMAPNTKDVKYLLWLSKNLQKNPNDPYSKMRAEAVKYRLDHEDVPDVIAKDGMYQSNDGKARDLGDLPKAEYQEATDGQIHFRTTPSAGTALDRYHRSLDAHGYMFTESYMDSMLSLKNLMTAILPGKKIEDIASSENPYMLQNTMQGAMSDAAQMFERNVMKPLDKAMAQVLDAFDGKKDDEKIRNFNLYMITKHGLERNRILYVRDALKDMRMDEKKKKLADTIENDWNNEKATLDEKLERGDIDLKEYYKQMDDFIRTYVDETNKFDAGEHDYSGIHAIQEVEKNSDPYDDAEAIQSVMDSEGRMEDIKKGAVKDYWDKVKTATQYAIDCDYRNGLISRELYGHVSAMFNWYVPLRKYDEATAEDTYGYITEKGDPKSYIGKTIMRARGHKYLSETNILAQIGAMGNRAIKNGGQNAIKQAFARFIRNNSNNNLVTETSVWYVSDPITQTTVERYPDIPDDATADEINQIVSDFNMEMKDLASKGLATKVYRRGRIGYKFQRAENKSQHIVDVMIAGKKHSFIVNGNPRAAQALNGLLENSAAKGIMKPLGSISRMMAQLCTSYNPEFVMRNIMRDAEFASSNVTTKEGARYGGLWAKYYAQLGLYKGASNISMKDLQGSTGLGLFAKYRNGTLDMNDKIQRYFKEFMENGGETGWVQIKNMKEWEKQYKQDVKGERSKVQRGGKMVRDFFFGNLENLNEVAENIARFSTYCASRDFGRSVVRSTYDAKEVSTNFNRHGSGDAIKSFKNGEMTGTKAAARWAYGFTSSYLRHCSMFFNAGIQSTNLLVKNLKNHPVGTSVNMLSIPFALGALGALLNNALIASEDEKDRNGVKDPYGELPDYVRRNNLCIYKGGGEFITIPLAIELRAFYGLGDLAAGLTFSPNVSGQKNPYLDAVGCMSQLVPVMDYLGNSSAGKKPLEETIKAISPSAIAPFIEWEQNSDWKGAPIERRGDWNENVPAWQRAYNGTPEGLKTLNKWVNAQTNDVAKGNEDMLGNGFLDMVTNPSMVNHFFGGIGGGAATFAERTLGAIKHGSDTETKDIPFVRSLLYTPSEQSSLQRTKSKWYNYKDEMEKTIANVDRLKSKNVPIDKRLTNVADYYNFQNSKDAAKVRVIELAEKQMKQWKKLRDKSGDNESIKFANENIDRIMMDAVEQLDKLN